MTDKEMALHIGETLITLKQERAALRSILLNCKTPDGHRLEWQSLLKETMEAPLLIHEAQDQRDRLIASIGSQDESSALLRNLHRSICLGGY